MNTNNINTLFPPHTYDQWREVVDQQLKGAPFDKVLVKKTYEGIPILPMYSQQNLDQIPHLNALPGARPYVRGSKCLGFSNQTWQVCQMIPYPDPEQWNQAICLDLSRGQTSVGLPLDKASQKGLDPKDADGQDIGHGVSIATQNDVLKALNTIDLETIPIRIISGCSGLSTAALIVAHMNQQNQAIKKLSGTIVNDPLGQLVIDGTLPVSLNQAYQEMAQLTRWAITHAPLLKTIGVNASPYHESGGNAVQELACCLATTVEYIRAMLSHGLDIKDVAPRIELSLSIGSDFFMEIAKCRAARLLWEHMLQAFGADHEACKLTIHANTSQWNKTKVDPYVNMLRVVTEGFSAICGGCDSIHIGPFDDIFRLPTPLSRRIARNVQIILRDECHFNQVIDPAGGSYYVEVITDELARNAWTLFQDIEKNGGMATALSNGYVKQLIEPIAQERFKNIASRKHSFVGTNKYPYPIDFQKESIPDPDTAFIQKRKNSVANDYESSDLSKVSAVVAQLKSIASNMSDQVVITAIQAASLGATRGMISQAIRVNDQQKSLATITPLRIHRGAEPFERLRDATEAYVHKTGNRPKVFLANMGPIPQHKARADFSYGFFSVASFDIVTNNGFQSVDAACDAANQSGAKVIVICSTDDAYPEFVPPLTQQLKNDDPDRIVMLAGYPKDHIASFKEAGVDDFIHLRSNTLDQLQDIQKRLGVIQ